MKKNKFFIAGGDLRQLACAEELSKKGYEVVIWGFSDEYTSDFNVSENPKNDIKNSDYLILPLPVTYDKKTLNTPLFDGCIQLKTILENVNEDTVIFGGMVPEELKSGFKFSDYGKNEEFLIKNAAITAEGAFNIIFSETPISVFKSKFLITGYGRIGKIMAKIADALGADVSVAARKTSDLSWIEFNGFKTVKYKNLKDEISKFDIIVNTVPHRIFTPDIIKNIKKSSFYIDLASIPGGCDMKDMQAESVKAIHALALPGKIAPYSSGRIISDTVTNMTDKE